MKGVLEHLERGKHSTIGFTENAELIEFAPDGGKVQVSCTYTTAGTTCELAGLKDAWLGLRHPVLAKLGSEYPRLAANPVLAELRL
ncbi:hypothetical protein [Streptomyces sp. NPDC048665]|uniref:hypothetical protein n=1 Tax=Streptomyces sp. NPDC048665 TaxID=3155490 RepID=UPI003426861F